MRDLSRLLRPRSIAVVGGKPAAEVVKQNVRMGYGGQIWPVHPRLAGVEGFPAVRAPRDLPRAPDAVFLAVNRHLTIDYVREFAAMGAGGVVAYAAGFAELGAEGEALQATLRDAAGNMPVLGPNCYGLINYVDGALLWPDQHGGMRVPRGVAIVTQSGNIGCNMTMQRRGLPIAYLCTMGNQAVVGLSAALETLATDERVTAIGLHIEGIDDPDAFARAVGVARAHGKPVVAVKTGGSAVGAALTVTHTASLAGADRVVGALLRRLGVARVDSIPVLLETLKLLHLYGPLRSGDIASMSCSGGEAALIADRVEGRRIRFRPFDTTQRAAVGATLSDLVTVSNPLDYNTFSWANREALTATFTAVMRQDFDMTALILDYPRADRCDEADWAVATDALLAAHGATGAHAAVIATLPECLPEAHAVTMMAAGVLPLLGLDDALDAIEAAILPLPVAAPPPITARPPAGMGVTLDEARSKDALAAYGVAVPRARGARPPAGRANGRGHGVDAQHRRRRGAPHPARRRRGARRGDRSGRPGRPFARRAHGNRCGRRSDRRYRPRPSGRPILGAGFRRGVGGADRRYRDPAVARGRSRDPRGARRTEGRETTRRPSRRTGRRYRRADADGPGSTGVRAGHARSIAGT